VIKHVLAQHYPFVPMASKSCQEAVIALHDMRHESLYMTRAHKDEEKRLENIIPRLRYVNPTMTSAFAMSTIVMTIARQWPAQRLLGAGTALMASLLWYKDKC